MKKKTDSLKIILKVALATVALAGVMTWTESDSAKASSTTTTAVSRGLIVDGPKRIQCLAPTLDGSGLTALQSAVNKFDGMTDTSVTCLSTYLSGARAWSDWERPWVTQTQYGYTSWVAEAPTNRQLILQVDLIPLSLKNIKHPLSWERSCAAGDFDAHATQLGTSLVAAGLQHSVIRLGAEMNGNWETDFAGTTAAEQQLWVRCFQNEVVGLRHATGEHFLIDWDPNPCNINIPYHELYPGNAFVDIIGIDLFDISCTAPSVPYSFARLSAQPAGLSSFEALARKYHKPMSFPEWGLLTKPSGDDPNFIDGVGATFTTKDFAFETYFDISGGRSKVLPLGSRTPLSIPAYQRWFGNQTKP